MKIASGAADPASASGALPSTTSRPARRTPRHCGGCARRGSGRCSMRDRAKRGIGQHPFDGDGARAGADVPEQLVAARRQRRQRHRADFALGDLAVMLEQHVGKPAARASTRASGAASTSSATTLSASTSPRSKSAARMAADALARAAKRFQHRELRVAEADCRPKASPTLRAPSPSEVSARMRAPGCRCGRIRSSGRPCSESKRYPATPSPAGRRRG